MIENGFELMYANRFDVYVWVRGRGPEYFSCLYERVQGSNEISIHIILYLLLLIMIMI